VVVTDEDSTGSIIGTQAGLMSRTGKGDLFVLTHAASIKGIVMIQVGLVNHGTVDADTSGTLALTCAPKIGAGSWKVSASGAKLSAQAPVGSTRNGTVQVSNGTLEIRQNWRACFDVIFTGGVVDTTADVWMQAIDCYFCDTMCNPMGCADPNSDPCQ